MIFFLTGAFRVKVHLFISSSFYEIFIVDNNYWFHSNQLKTTKIKTLHPIAEDHACIAGKKNADNHVFNNQDTIYNPKPHFLAFSSNFFFVNFFRSHDRSEWIKLRFCLSKDRSVLPKLGGPNKKHVILLLPPPNKTKRPPSIPS